MEQLRRSTPLKILLDTNTFIWWVADDPRLGEKARQAISSLQNDVYVSNLSLLECSIKVRIGKLRIDFDAVDIELSERRLLELRYDTAAARQFVDLASLPQSDPFDIALIAQAITKKMTLITSDHHILTSTVSGLYCQDAEK